MNINIAPMGITAAVVAISIVYLLFVLYASWLKANRRYDKLCARIREAQTEATAVTPDPIWAKPMDQEIKDLFKIIRYVLPAKDQAVDALIELYAICETNERLLAERQNLLDHLPACPLHGSGCIPYIIVWRESVLEELRAGRTVRHNEQP